jgi:hypothetical protein
MASTRPLAAALRREGCACGWVQTAAKGATFALNAKVDLGNGDKEY